MPTAHSTFVHFGGCWNGDHEVPLGCAVDHKSCPATPTDHSKAPVNNYHSVALLASTEYAGSDKHDECTAEGVADVATTCEGAEGLCQVTGIGNDGSGRNGEACPGSTTEGCNLLSTVVSSSENGTEGEPTSALATIYGACHDPKTREIACAWNAESCADGQVFLSPAELFLFLVEGDVKTDNLYCDCSQVRVGACGASAAYGRFCSVQASSCGTEEIFATVQDLEKDGEECRLCEALPEDVRMNTDFYFAQRKSELIDALAQGRRKSQVLLSDSHPSNQIKPSARSAGSVTAVIGVMGMLLALFGAAMVLRARRRRHRLAAAAASAAIHRDDDSFIETHSGGRYTDERDDEESDIPAANKTFD